MTLTPPPQTLAQKALARPAGLAHAEAGQVVDVRPDVVLSHDNTAAIRRICEEFSQTQVEIPDRIAVTLDHAVPAPTTKHAQNRAEVRRRLIRCRAGEFVFPPLSPGVLQIVAAGGLSEHAKRKLVGP